MRIAPYILARLGVREIAGYLESTGAKNVREILGHINSKKRRKLLHLLSPHTLEAILREIGSKEMADILAHMKDAEAVAVLRKLSKKSRRKVIANLPKREKTVYSFLLRFSKDVAGGWMRADVQRVHPKDSVAKIRKVLKEHNGYAEHIIVETEDGIFFGIIPITALLHAPRNARAEDIAIGSETVETETSSEDLARIFTTYNPEIVVVLDEGKVLGVVTREEAIPLLEKEHEEDLAKIFSMRGVDHVWTPLRKAVKNRTPWLIINLFTAFLAASVVNIFEGTLRTFTLLAVFMPIVPGEAGNATTQMRAIVVRGAGNG